MRRLLLLTLLSLAPPSLCALDLYVSPSGSDSNSGTLASPFATLAKARVAIEAYKSANGLPAGGITVWLRAGYYNQSSTFELTASDSGAAGSPIVYSAYPGEMVYITGAIPLDASGFSLVTSSSPVWSRLDPSAQGNVYSIGLPSQGITNYGTIKPGGFSLSVVAPLELFFNGQPMVLARWPNAGQPLARTVTAPSGTQFTYSGSRPSRWTQAQDVWMHGLWNSTWADFQLDVTSINTSTNTVNLASSPQCGIGPNQPYYAYNLLEEIDSPGEYYVDRAAGILYFWPPAPLAGSTLQASMLEGSLVILSGTSYVSFRNITFEATRSQLLQILSGSSNGAVGCLFRNCGQYAVLLTGTSNGLDQCEIADSGEDGVVLEGGNRATLTAGNNYVTNCRFHRTSRISWSFHPAINFSDSCGDLASNNLIDELPHSAVILSGNDNVIESNEISRVCQLTSDSGAIYSGRDWGYRGNVVSGNFIHHVEFSQDGANTHGVFLDDLMSSAQVSGNVLYAISGSGIMCGGGRDNIMTNNIIAECGIGHYNGDYARSWVTNIPGDSFNLLQRLAADGIQYQADPWLTAYPTCAAIPDSFTLIEQGLWRNPQGCVFSNNAGWSNTSWMTEYDVSGTGVFEVYAAIANNNSSQAALFSEAMSWDRTLRPAQLTASVSGFTPIPFASIGPLVASPSSVTLAPPVPVLEGLGFTNSEADFQWTDDGIHPMQQASGFEVQRMNNPNGPWTVLQTFGPDVDYAQATGLAASTGYSFRIRSFNPIGSVYSNAISVVSGPPAQVPGSPTQTLAGSPLTVINDVRRNGTVSVLPPTQLAGPRVAMYDVGDAIQITFTTTAGLYNIGVRARCGYNTAPTSYWPSGYQFNLDGNIVTLVGDPTTVSAYDSAYGGCYWGTMTSSTLQLAAGTHTLTVTSEEPWAVVNYLSVTPLVPPQVTTFTQWQQAHFSLDQQGDPTVSGWNASPTGDGFLNLMKYALGLDPWTSVTGSGVQVALASGEPQLTFSEPVALTDVSYFAEVSNDLSTWTALPQVTIAQSNGIATIQATETGAAQQFIRLRITSGSWTASTAVLATGVTGVVGAGNPLTVLRDVGVLGTVGVATDSLNHWQCVRMYDVGDKIQVSFVSASGSYVIGALVRSGDTTGPTSFWQGNAYTFTLDGNPLALTGNPATVSALDTSSFGSVYWGTMSSAPVTLSQGTHSIVITAAHKWDLAVSVQTIPQPAP